MSASKKISISLSVLMLFAGGARANIGDFSELQTAITNGGNYILSANIDADAALSALGGDFTLDGKGKTITGTTGLAGLTVNDGQAASIKNIGNWTGFLHHLINYGELSVSNIKFNNNELVEPGSSLMNGGIIRNRGHITEIDRVTMDGNTVSAGTPWGGLIMNGTQNNDGITSTLDKITNSVFTNNYVTAVAAAPHGAIILNMYGGHIGLIDNVLIANNTMTSTPDKFGGAHGVGIDNNSGGIIGTISNSVFRNNKTFRTGDATTTSNYHASAGALDNYGSIELIKNVVFEKNSAECVACSDTGGAIMTLYTGTYSENERSGYIGGIENTKFLENHVASTTLWGTGGAMSSGIMAGTTGVDILIGYIKNTIFDGNYATGGTYAIGGGWSHFDGKAGNITDVTFSNNYANGGIYAAGGAVGNLGQIGDFNRVSFSDNYVTGIGTFGMGGAIYSSGTIGNITDATFQNNYAIGASYARGGAIYNSGTIGNLTNVTFRNNFVQGGTAQSYGGAISNSNTAAVAIGDMTNVKFIGNYVFATDYNSLGGAMTVAATTGKFTNVLFDGNYVEVTNSYARAGALFAAAGALDMDKVTFRNNYVLSGTSYTRGGAMMISATTGAIVNTDFIDNYAQTAAATELAIGGGAYIAGDKTFRADGANSFFTGNYTSDSRGRLSSGIFLGQAAAKTLTFDMINGGNFVFDDAIETAASVTGTAIDYSVHHNIAITGDGTGRFFMNNDIINAGNISVDNAILVFGKGEYGRGRILPGLNADGTADLTSAAVTSLALNDAEFYLYNKYYDTVNLVNYAASGDSLLHLDVGKVAGVWTTDVLNISGDITGQTKVVVYSSSFDTDFTNLVFADAPNDTANLADAFSVYRVYGNPFMWNAERNILGTETGSVWYLTQTNTDNDHANELPDPINPPEYNATEVTPEVIGYRGLHAASLEQTRSMVWNVRNHAAGKDTGYNAWVAPVYFSSTISSPVHIESSVKGAEAGFDFQPDDYNKIGAFVSYRMGDYDLNGAGEQYYSTVASEIGIDSYMAGLYYELDYRNMWVFATLYGGAQSADLSTKDGINTATDGIQFGASAEVGQTYEVASGLNVVPSLGISYTSLSFDDIRDSVGKTARYDAIGQLEVEAGVKLEKEIKVANGIAKIYLRPGVIRPVTMGDAVAVTGLGKLNTYNDRTLGRITLGGQYAITGALAAYGFVGSTFGSGYDATSLGLGVNYSW